MLAASGMFAMLLITQNQYSRYYYAGINLCITWTLFIVGLRFINSLSTVCLIVFIYNLVAFYKNLPIVDIITNNFFLVSNAIIGIFAGYTIEQQARWQFYQSLTLKNNSQKLHRAMLAASLDTVITFNKSGQVVEFSEAAERLFGCSRQQALGAFFSQFIPLNTLPTLLEALFQTPAASGHNSLPQQRFSLQASTWDKHASPLNLPCAQWI